MWLPRSPGIVVDYLNVNVKNTVAYREHCMLEHLKQIMKINAEEDLQKMLPQSLVHRTRKQNV